MSATNTTELDTGSDLNFTELSPAYRILPREETQKTIGITDINPLAPEFPFKF